MPVLQDLQPAFNAGELTPRLAARLDFVKYRLGLSLSENLILLAEGGAMRRSGSRFIAEVSDSSVKHRLKRFRFNVTQAYILELGEQCLRFYRHQGQITVADTDAVVSNGTFDSNITGWDDRSTGGAGNQISHDSTNNRLTLETNGTAADDIGWAEQDITTTATGTEHVIKFRVAGDPGDKIEFQIGTSSTNAEIIGPVEKEVGYHCVAFTPDASPFYIQFRNLGANADKDVYIDDVALIDNAAVEIDTPWSESELFDVEGPQSADVLYLYHETTPTHKLQRLGHTTWSLTEVAWIDGPYLDINDTTTTLTPSATTGVAVTVTASSKTGINDGNGFLATDVGRSVRIDNPAAGVNWGWGIIVARASTTSVTVHVKEAFGATTADTRWHLGAWSSTTGYPQSASFFEQRQYIGATTDRSQTFWASQVGLFEDMTPDDGGGTVEDDDAFSYTLNAEDVNAIRWLSAGDDELAIGTEGGVWIPKSSGAAITALDVSARIRTTFGSAKIQPIRIGDSLLYIQRAKRKIREFVYTIERDGYVAPDMTRLAEHITRGGIIETAYAEEPDSIVWMVRNDGQLIAMTFRRDEDVVGLSRQILGGSFSSGNAVVESVETIPGANGAGQTQDSTARNEVWSIVKRTINSATKRYIEVLERDYDDSHDQEDSYYADSLITYDGAAATTLSGYDHLEGETLKVLADGAIVADKTVSSGQITLDTAASVVQAGLGYKHKLETLKVSAGNPAGTPIGKKKRIYGATFALLNAHTIAYGRDSSNLTETDFREISDPMDAAAPFFTGERFVEFHGDWTRDSRIYLESDDPVPFGLLAIAPDIQLNPVK